ncbi:hypothetical protein BVRB_033240 [Beta vulgaris subsp. vulgaris]|uniref:Uncharacterized protein n=1 Tax=Beta vulgaris subsp. vulgaris TaxID=3555 RepID=A0A0J8B050_BETVV|nr:hypothetical protein BVRB_033240 [Beta vulgaris subsp. vulgaris]
MRFRICRSPQRSPEHRELNCECGNGFPQRSWNRFRSFEQHFTRQRNTGRHTAFRQSVKQRRTVASASNLNGSNRSFRYKFAIKMSFCNVLAASPISVISDRTIFVSFSITKAGSVALL